MKPAMLIGRAARLLRLPLAVTVVAATVIEAVLLVKLDRSLRRLDGVPPDTFADDDD